MINDGDIDFIHIYILHETHLDKQVATKCKWPVYEIRIYKFQPIRSIRSFIKPPQKNTLQNYNLTFPQPLYQFKTIKSPAISHLQTIDSLSYYSR